MTLPKRMTEELQLRNFSEVTIYTYTHPLESGVDLRALQAIRAGGYRTTARYLRIQTMDSGHAEPLHALAFSPHIQR